MLRPLRLLLVEDDPATARLTAEALRATTLPYSLTTVSDGAAALALLRQEGPPPPAPRPDLIVSDLHLPRLSGLELLAALKADPQVRAIPVVLFTTSEAPHDVAQAYRDGVAAYVLKPADLERYFAVVAQLLQFFNEVILLPQRP